MAGVLTVATPCIIPILPPMLAGSVGHRLRPIMIVLGMSVTFTLMGGLFSALGIASGISGGFYRVALAFVIMGFGAVMVDEDINRTYTRYSSMLVNSIMGRFRRGTVEVSGGESLKGAFVLGLTLGIVWIPCVGPILGAVLTYASVLGDVTAGSLLLLAYSAGLSLPMLAIAYGGKSISSRSGILKDNAYLLRRIAGWVLILSGIVILLGIDKIIQTALLPYTPDIEGMILGGK
ncbi:MAG: cytochrome c biogenesis CcdA family protein [Candidatus Hydrothermarchaeaceae archaeon]